MLDSEFELSVYVVVYVFLCFCVWFLKDNGGEKEY